MPREEGRVKDVNQRFINEERLKEERYDGSAYLQSASALP